jgi:hypothetical protein
MIMSIWAYETDSYFGTCNTSIIGLKDTVKLFILYTSTPFYESVAGIQEISFAGISTLEYPYPISSFCYSAIFEVRLDMIDRYQLFTH